MKIESSTDRYVNCHNLLTSQALRVCAHALCNGLPIWRDTLVIPCLRENCFICIRLRPGQAVRCNCKQVRVSSTSSK